MAGYVKLYRQLESWEWYTDVNTTKLFLHCLIKASRNDYRWKGTDLKKGQFPTSYEKLSKENGLSVSQVRTSIKKLILTGELTKTVTDEKTIITVINWEHYQGSDSNSDNDIDKEVDSSMTRESQGDDKGVTTTNKYKKEENTNKDKDCIKKGVFETFAGDDEELKNSLKEFNQMRTKIGKPMTDKAKGMICTKLLDLQSKGDNMNDCINQSILNCWTGVFPIMEEKNFQKKQKKVPSFLDMLKEEENEPK